MQLLLINILDRKTCAFVTPRYKIIFERLSQSRHFPPFTEADGSLLCPQGPTKQRSFVTFSTYQCHCVSARRYYTSLSLQVRLPSLVGCPSPLLIHCIRKFSSIYGSRHLYPEPEDAPCLSDKGPLK